MSEVKLLAAYQKAKERLLAEIGPEGHWVGELSTSALATATAVVAMEMVARHKSGTEKETLNNSARQGIEFLVRGQNADGGWGDTAKSRSNISTTMLAHAAFHATLSMTKYPKVVDRARDFIDDAGGVPALKARYGKDRTFSVPILTQCALSGVCGWEEVSSLPFEMACLPASFYKFVQLPVVSYALPALIAIGQARHHHRPSANPLARAVRNWARTPSLQLLEKLQPETGGFLEATPLTSFVTMSLAASGQVDHPVVPRAIQFLLSSMREDGGWPIDTNLATWVTTLSINALGADLPAELRPRLLQWLLGQQYKTVHPFTQAAPGGWAWTDLTGGVPDSDDTPGAILAIRRLSDAPFKDKEVRDAASFGIRWLLDLQNRDGGWPTFCRGWGYLPFDRSSLDLTAHALRAFVAWRADLPADHPLQGRIARAMETGRRFLLRGQRADGAWLPLWFGNQDVVEDENPTYGTARVLMAFRDAGWLSLDAAKKGMEWLRMCQNADGGWGGGPGAPSSVEETALAVEALLEGGKEPEGGREASHVERGIDWLCGRVEENSFAESAPIGFYFAKLWYFERLYPIIFLVSALGRAKEQQRGR